MNPLLEQLTHRPFPELAETLRRQAGEIILEWQHVVREAMPQMDRLTFDEMRDSLPKILPAMADALASSDPHQIASVLEHSPAQGLARFSQHFKLAETLQEDRLLRGVIVLHLEATLGRQMTSPEAAALHAVIDVMLQQAVLALVGQQERHIRSAAENQLKYLSFLSHDLNNNLSMVTLTLGDLRRRLAGEARYAEEAESAAAAEQSITETIDGMRRLTSHESLRHYGQPRPSELVDLHALAKDVAAQFAKPARAKGLQVVHTTLPNHVARAEPALLRLVVQNLVGNAVKYSAAGRVIIRSERVRDAGAWRWSVTVSDEGPGIPPAQRDRLYESFRRGDTFGTEGFGLGLSIVSQAARLLNAELRLESEAGRGTAFTLLLPPQADPA